MTRELQVDQVYRHSLLHSQFQSASRANRASRLRRFFEPLFRPHPSVQGEVAQRRSQLLGTMSLIVFIIGTLLVVNQIIDYPGIADDPDTLMIFGGLLLSLGVFIANRLGYVEQAARLFLATLFGVILFVPFIPGASELLLYFVVVPILLTAVFFSLRRMLQMSLVVLGVTIVFALTTTTTSPAHALWIIQFEVLVIGVIYVFIRYLRFQESVRARQLEAANQQLKASEELLEHRVEERTRELQQARQEAEEANKIKSQFLANMSHELRTPLNAILNFTAFVADGVMGPVNEEQVDALHLSINSGKHLLALINDILDITKIEAGLMDLFIQDIDMNEILGSVAALGKGLVKDRPIELVVEIDEHLPVTYGDKRRLRQVFLNVLSNSVKFTPEGHVAIRATASDQRIRVEVRDTGIGIRPEDQGLVFESFKQVRNDLPEAIGTGLGMPISKYFVECHGGQMWFESQYGMGTTFYIELPVLTEAQANSLTAELEKSA
jgi:signal transduction histidine kinase